MEKQRRIAFIGPMGSGKSSLAAAYGELICKAVFDTDACFIGRYGEINAFFGEFGEGAFRKAERELVLEGVNSQCAVISCGGGVVLDKACMNALRGACDIVYIKADTDVIEKRIRDSDRPLKKDHRKIFAERKALYERYADYTVNGNAKISDVAAELTNKLKDSRRNRYDVILCDADDTVLDFQMAMKFSIAKTASDLGVRADKATVIAEYEKILPVVWGRLERGEITRDMLADMRFTMLRDALGAEFDCREFNDAYMKNIKTTRFVIDGALEFLDEVRSKGMRVYIITNSYRSVASERLKALDGHIDGAFVSEDIGFDKPDTRFFEWVASSVGAEKDRTLVFGDGVYPDIHGGKAFGTDTCLFDPRGGKNSDEADFTVRSYSDVWHIL